MGVDAASRHARDGGVQHSAGVLATRYIYTATSLDEHENGAVLSESQVWILRVCLACYQAD